MKFDRDAVLLAIISFALGVIVTGVAYDIRDSREWRAVNPPAPRTAPLGPRLHPQTQGLVCEHGRVTGSSRSCGDV